jgi:hypothetical protein
MFVETKQNLLKIYFEKRLVDLIYPSLSIFFNGIMKIFHRHIIIFIKPLDYKWFEPSLKKTRKLLPFKFFRCVGTVCQY